MKKKLRKSIQAIIFGLVIGMQSFVMPLHAEGITTPSVQPDFTQVPDDTFFSDVDFKAVAKDLSKSFVVFGDALTGATTPWEFTWNGFKSYLEYKESLVLEQHPTIGVRNTVTGEQSYDIPQDLKQEIVNFVQVEIQGNPLGYTSCYIPTYKKLGASYFSNYNTYKTLLNYMENMSKKGGYLFFISIENTSSVGFPIRVLSVPTSLNWNFYGSVLNGSFNGVQLGVDWAGSPTLANVYNYPEYTPYYEGVEYYMIRSDNGAQLSNRWVGNVSAYTFGNYTGLYVNCNTVFSSSTKDENVYVFDNMNSYKNYNSGYQQKYYFTSEGLENPNWNAPTGYVNSNNVDNSYRYYNNVVSNVQSGWTADEVLALVDRVTSSSNGSNSGSSDDDDDDGDNWLDGLFSGIVGTIKGIITEISDGIVGIIHMVFGYDDDEGVHHEGVLTNIITMLSSGFTGFLTDIFSFLPSEFVALFTAFLTLSILFGVIKLIRGA